MDASRLITERLILVPWTAADGADFHALWGDGRVIWWGPSASLAQSRDTLREILARCAAMPAGLGWWAVRHRERGELVGNVVLQPAVYDETVELGYHLMHRAWGRGYGTEAARAVMRHGFGTLGLAAISAVVHVDNGASQRVMARLGFGATGEVTFNSMPHRRYLRLRDAATPIS